MSTRLTAVFVESVKPPARGQRAYFDPKLPGFGLRVSQGGTKTWVILYRINGKQKWHKVGTHPPLSLVDARAIAKGKLADVQRGEDPERDKQEARQADSFADLAERYLVEHAKVHKKTAAEDERIINRELLPEWRSRKASDISRRDVIALTDAIALHAKVQANRVLALISRIFNFGIAKEIVETNPAYRLPKPGGAESERERVLNEDEIQAVWQSVEKEPFKTAALFKLLLLTAQRRGEVSGMRWDELELERGWWTIPAERSKNGLAHRVPLGPLALAILKQIEVAAHDETFVFRGGRRNQAIANLQKPAKRLKDDSKIEFRTHDLRRTAASHMASLGVPRLVISKLLNHVERGVTKIYERYSYDREKRDALNRWDRRVAEIVAGKPKVVRLAKPVSIEDQTAANGDH